MRKGKMSKYTYSILLLLAALALLTGCAQVSTKGAAFPNMYAQKPVSILALPPVNTTSSPVAKEYVVCTIPEPVTYSGYYLIPIQVSNEILQKEGLYDTEMITPELYPKFKELFDADAVLITKIFKWDTSYYVVGGNVTVGLNYTLISTTTGDVLWSYSGVRVVDTGSSNQGGGLAGLAVAMVATAIKTATTDYIPIAKQVNTTIFSTLPKGKYNKRCGLDKNDQFQMIDDSGKIKTNLNSRPAKP